ncbi:asparagine synthase-related protein [Oceanobacillus sp. CF4.6]|uniref:asparagine synthase-related protein n=1 Tax=Oceanobacillus sp. CF4.6 TaxID=3373080 RepID=UPI003EE73136
MSAIAGIYHFNKEPIPSNYGFQMMKALQKFPADDSQIWQQGNIFLGCHSQWITPESIGEQLPYYDHERQLAITVDAIIDNREDLFEQLQIPKPKQINFPDSQLILLAYQKWGEDCTKYLIGDFSFLIWNNKTKSLFAARDFSGSRTLYYYHSNNRIVFSTTIEQLFSLPNIQRELEEQWLAEYLAISGVVSTVDVSLTPYKNIYQIPPAHQMLVAADGKIKISRYCSFENQETLHLSSSEEYVAAFQEVFDKAIKSRLRTHHQVGAHLSGGLDSGSVVSFAAKHLKKENKLLHTFSYIPAEGFQDYTPKQLIPDERPYIKETVNYVGGIKDFYMDSKGESPYTVTDTYLDMLEMPYKFFENSYWQQSIYEEANKKEIGVLLTGGRGNMSISWGNALDYYSTLLRQQKWIKLIWELNYYSYKVGGARLRRLPLLIKLAYPKLFPGNAYEMPKIIDQDFEKRTNVYKKLKQYGILNTGNYASTNALEQRLQHFEFLYPWNPTNTKATKMSLRYRMWERDPTNDLRVIRFCLSVPQDQYVQHGMDRALIRSSTKGFLPDTIRLNQKNKGIQSADWVYRMTPHWDEFLAEMEELIREGRVFEYIDKSIIVTALSKAQEGPLNAKAIDPYYRILMRIMILARFLRTFT